MKGLRKGEKGIVVLAGDISPIDVISHLPVLCEDNDVPYVFVTSKVRVLCVHVCMLAPLRVLRRTVSPTMMYHTMVLRSSSPLCVYPGCIGCCQQHKAADKLPARVPQGRFLSTGQV